MEEDLARKGNLRKILLVINCCILAVGNCGGPLIMRLYFVRGGKRVWFSSWLETGGWPVIFIPLLISYFYRRCTATAAAETKPILMTYPVFAASAVIGVLTGFDDYMYAYGVARLPVSTSAIVIATQLGFTALFAFFLVKQKFTAYSVNAIVLLTLGSGVLALHTSSDRPAGETSKMYVLGFVLTLAAAALYGLILPLVELMYMKAKQGVTYTLVLEIQMVMCFFATAFCTVGMLVNHDFQVRLSSNRSFFKSIQTMAMAMAWLTCSTTSNSRGSKSLRAGRNEVLHGGGVERCNMAILFSWSHRSNFLFVIFAFGDHDCGFTPGHRSFGGNFLQ